MWVCSACGLIREKPEKRPPNAWKRRADEVFCADCWEDRYVLRAISIPVASPIDCEWQELDVALRTAWALTTQACNWMLTELYTRDFRRNGEEKMPAMAPVYLYPETRQRFPGLPSQTCAALERTVQAKYRAARYKLIWTCQVSLPTYRYPTPFPVPNQGWSVTIEEQRIVVSARIGDKRLRFRLRGGPGFRRQRNSVDQLVSGSAVQGELALYKSGKDTMCKMVAWLPRLQPKGTSPRSGILRVRTDNDMLLLALNEKDETLWKYYGDQIVRWSAEHRRQLQRWADDSKAEQRPVPSFSERRKAAAIKYRRRMDTAAKEIAAMLCGYAARRKFAGIRYDDSNTSYCDGFPWFALRERIKVKLDELGIAFEHASGEAAEEPPQRLAEDVK
jgi:hypothetical protein